MEQILSINCVDCPVDKLQIKKGDMGLWFEVVSPVDNVYIKMHKLDVEALIKVLQHYVATGNLEQQP